MFEKKVKNPLYTFGDNKVYYPFKVIRANSNIRDIFSFSFSRMVAKRRYRSYSRGFRICLKRKQ